MIHYLLDTDICIELLRNRASHVVRKLRKFDTHEIAISAITLAELQYGVAKSAAQAKHQMLLIQFCTPLAILPFDGIAAEIYGILRNDLEHEGQPIGPLDTLIAAHALALDAPLVTNNEREFRRVKNLKIENWLAKK